LARPAFVRKPPHGFLNAGFKGVERLRPVDRFNLSFMRKEHDFR
jgi:hypothetical protein